MKSFFLSLFARLVSPAAFVIVGLFMVAFSTVAQAQQGRNGGMPSAYQQLNGAQQQGMYGQQGYSQYAQQQSRNYGMNSAYQQIPQGYGQQAPAPAPVPEAKPKSEPKPEAKPSTPSIPGQPAEPVPYPTLEEPAPKPAKPDAPKVPDNAQLANDIMALRNYDQLQDQRITELERRALGGQPVTRQPVQPQPTIVFLKHQVRIGESLWGIADRYHVSPEDIRRANRLPSEIINVDEVLNIPQLVRADNSGEQRAPAPKKKDSTPSAKDTLHIVQKGETLSSIAAAYHVSLRSLTSANGIRNVNVIRLGRKLTIPGGGGVMVKARTQPAVIKKNEEPKSSRRVLAETTPKAQPKESLLIAPAPPPVVEKPKAPAPTVAAAKLPAPSKVIAPSGPRGITSYAIGKGDTIETVAKTFATTPSEIKRLNGLDGKLPPVGDEIVVPMPGSVTM